MQCPKCNSRMSKVNMTSPGYSQWFNKCYECNEKIPFVRKKSRRDILWDMLGPVAREALLNGSAAVVPIEFAGRGVLFECGYIHTSGGSFQIQYDKCRLDKPVEK